MFFVSLNGAKKKNKVLILFVLAVLAVMVFIMVYMCINNEGSSEFDYSAETYSETALFLRNFGLEYDDMLSSRTIILPSKNDEAFVEYSEIQPDVFNNVLKYSEKEAEERFIRLKNKTSVGEKLYAQLIIYKGKAVGGYLTDLKNGAFSFQNAAYK